MKKIIIIVFIVFLSGTAYADSAWDRMVQESESCAMAAYDISPTPISREVSRDAIIRDESRRFTNKNAKNRISRHALSIEDRATMTKATKGPGDLRDYTPVIGNPDEPPINPAGIIRGDTTAITAVNGGATYVAVPINAGCEAVFSEQ